MKRIVLCAGLLAALVGGCDKKDKAAPGGKATLKEPQKIWVVGMLDKFPAEACKDGSIFRKCVDGDQPTCLKDVAAALQACFDENPGAMPDPVNSDTGAKAGQTYGECAGNKYEELARSQKRMHETHECTGK